MLYYFWEEVYMGENIFKKLSESLKRKQKKGCGTEPSKLCCTDILVINEPLEDMKLVYGIRDDEVLQRLWIIKAAIEDKRQEKMEYDEFLLLLKNIMNYGDMQIWLMKQRMEGKNITLEESLKRFFELNSDEDILNLCGAEQNYNQLNIQNIQRVKNNKVRRW